jgi:hypothetical protein
MFVSELHRKAERAGGELIAFSTRETRLSQYDHTTREYVRKPLSQRTHIFGDGVTLPIHRDLYSGFLARFVESNVLDAAGVEQSWPSAEPLLRRAASRFQQSAIGKGFPLPNARKRVRADRPSKRSLPFIEAVEAVALRESHGEMESGALRTPWF